MAEKQLTPMRVAILVSDDFEQVEMTKPKKALEAAGAKDLPAFNPAMVELFAENTSRVDR
jgi:putative intracellular protease/amidase